MTIKEAIRRIRNYIGFLYGTKEPQEEICEALNMAIAALREKQAQENPKPLTIEELRAIKNEPVWLMWPDNRIKSQWWLINSYDWLMMEFDDPIMERKYGETWIAYRHKPKEDDHG